MGTEILQVLLQRMSLSCEVYVAVCPVLPLKGINMILGSDIAGRRVWAGVSSSSIAPTPVVKKLEKANAVPAVIITSLPLVSSEPDRNAKEFPEVFAACAVSHAMAQAQVQE